MANPELYPRREHVRRTDCYVQHDTKMTILGSQVLIMLDDLSELAAERDAAIDARLSAERDAEARVAAENERMIQRVSDAEEQSRRWRVRAETLEKDRAEERARADRALRTVVDTTKELVAAEFARDNARGTCKILGQSLDEARRHPSSVEAQEAMEALDDAGVPCAIGATLPSRVQWLAAQNRQLATAVAAATNGDAFVLTRTAWHLANGCDTVSRAAAEARRELAVVLGGGS